MERFVCVAVAVMLFFSSYSAKAEELDASLKAAEQNLSSIEQNLNSIESTKEIRKSNNAVEAQLDNYLKQMHAANQKKLERASKKAELDAVGAGEDVDVWERTLANHKARIEQVSNRIANIDKDIKEGKITVSREVIEEFSDEELEGFRQSVKEDVLQKKYSDIGTLHKDSFKWVSELLSPSEANAAIAAGCVSSCGAGNVPVCLGCIASAGTVGYGLYLYVCDIINDTCKNCRWRWTRIACQVAVITGYIVIIA